MLNQIKQLIWFSPQKKLFYIRYCRYVSQYEINDYNKHGHILVNVIHYSPFYKPFAGTFDEFRLYLIHKTSLWTLVCARALYFKRSLCLSLSSKLEYLAFKLRKF